MKGQGKGDTQRSKEEPLLSPTDSVIFDSHFGLSVPITAIWMVFLAIFIDNLGGQISTPIMPYYVKSFGVGNECVGYLFAAFQFTQIFCAPMLGKFSDKYGRRTVLLVSVIGAGIAGFAQAFSTSFTMLIISRAFAGIWGAVMPVARVYIADVCSPEVSADYMAYVSTVPGAAQTFGPGIGGGLSAFGLSAPLLVDGACSLAIAVLVFIYLPESPSFLKRSAGEKGTGKGKGKGKGGGKGDDDAKIPGAAYRLSASTMFFAMGMYSTNAMLPIALSSKFGFDPIHVGYVLTFIAIMRLIAGIWIAIPLRKCLGAPYAAGMCAFITGAFLILGVWVNHVWLCISALAISRMAANCRTSNAGALSTYIATTGNRGTVFSIIQTGQNVGKFVGPLIAGHLAVYDPTFAPLAFAGCSICLSTFLDASIRASSRTEAATNSADVVEEGEPQDYKELGDYVGNLLKSRHYPWITRKSEVYEMLDRVIIDHDEKARGPAIVVPPSFEDMPASSEVQDVVKENSKRSRKQLNSLLSESFDEAEENRRKSMF